MGLDMYLVKKTYISSYDDNLKIDIKINGKTPDAINPASVTEISEETGYWRKANHIHRWFVENVQEGEDDCGSYYVTDDHMKDLLETCKTVLKNRDKAPDLLPTTSGFFFGGTEYGDWYFQSVEQTIEILENALAVESNDDLWIHFEYQSSW